VGFAQSVTRQQVHVNGSQSPNLHTVKGVADVTFMTTFLSALSEFHPPAKLWPILTAMTDGSIYRTGNETCGTACRHTTARVSGRLFN